MAACVSAILLDMDGLMVDSEPIFWEVARSLAHKHGKTVTDSTLRSMMGRSRIEAMQILAGDCKITSESPESPESLLIAREQMLIQRYSAGVLPMPGLIDLLKHVHGKLKLAVVTSSPKAFTDVLLPAMGVTSYFDVVQTGDEIDRGKPDPQIYLRTTERLGVEGGDCVVLEDSHAGALAGHRAGAFVIAVPTPLTADEDFTFANARASNLVEARAIIEARMSVV